MRDDRFVRGSLPMTKSEVRAVSLSKLELEAESVLWDIGAGTGSVAVEAARMMSSMKKRDGAASCGCIYAVEKEEEGIGLIEQNRERLAPEFEAFHIVKGKAPGVLTDLPAPSHVFIGGSGGSLKEVLRLVLEKNPKARIVINSVTAETLAVCMEWIRETRTADYEIVQVAVSRMEKAGNYHLQRAQNPVYVITLQG